MELNDLEHVYLQYTSASDREKFAADYIMISDDYLSVAFVLALNEAGEVRLNFKKKTRLLLQDIEGLVDDSPLIKNMSLTGLIPRIYLSAETSDAVRIRVGDDGTLDSVYEFIHELELSEEDRSCIFYKGLVLAKKLQEKLHEEAEDLYDRLIDRYL